MTRTEVMSHMLHTAYIPKMYIVSYASETLSAAEQNKWQGKPRFPTNKSRIVSIPPIVSIGPAEVSSGDVLAVAKSEGPVA